MSDSFVATSLSGFIQQLAVCLVGRGYWFYVLGTVPDGKDPAKIDAKLSKRYRADISKWARLRRKRAGCCNVAYLRIGRTFVLVATHGLGEFFDEEGEMIRDARREPIKVGGYAVGFRGGHVSVRIELTRYREVRAYLLEIACRRTVPNLSAEITRVLSFEPYAGVRSQSACILRAVNRSRVAAGLEPVPRTCLRTRRRVVRPFEPVPDDQTAGEIQTVSSQGEIGSRKRVA